MVSTEALCHWHCAGMCCRVCSGAHPSIPCMQEVSANGKATCYSLKNTHTQKESRFLLLTLAKQPKTPKSCKLPFNKMIPPEQYSRGKD